ncbi:SIMPL domain-containing protein [Holospora obtusa]|nr:SIMPL domain-containing protein [Holospora obtusa]
MKTDIFKQLIFTVLCIFASLTFSNLSTQIGQKLSEKVLTVRGVSEKEVRSDLVSWKTSSFLLSNDTVEAIGKLEEFKKKFFDFCKEHKIDDADPNRYQVEIEDNWKNYYKELDKRPRYSVTLSIYVDSKEVEKIRDAKLKLTSALSSFPISSSLSFFYTNFSPIRDKMVQESFEDAQKAANCIAKSAGVKLEKVKTVTQGLFTITDSEKSSYFNTHATGDYQSGNLVKTIRTVSTVTFVIR